MFDIKIINGTIVDGSGKERYLADVGIKEDKIVVIGKLEREQAKLIINAEKMIVAPGFIDVHTHSDFSILYDPLASSRIHNGVTSDVIGNCGIGAAPVNEKTKELLITYLTTRIAGSIPVVKLELPWTTYAEYLEYMDSKPKAINIIPLLAAGTIRIHEMGFGSDEPTKEQMENMKNQVKIAMEAGACGLSSGLIYLPGIYCTTDELTKLATVLKPYNVKYVTHIRDEGAKIYDAIDEALNIARHAEIGVHISHLKLDGPKVWGQSEILLKKLEEARTVGIDVSWDAYPYQYGMSSLAAAIPSWCFKNGGVSGMLNLLTDPVKAEQIKEEMCIMAAESFSGSCDDAWNVHYIVSVTEEGGRWMEGKSLVELAEIKGMDTASAICDILLEQKGKVQVRMECTTENDMETILSHPATMVGSDSMSMSNVGILADGKTHPRAYGTQGKILHDFVREKGSFSLETAIRKMTSLPAELTQLDGRGLIKEGYFADVVVFNPDTVRDNATYMNPKQYTNGIEYVIVNGAVALEKGKQKNIFAGRVLRRKKQ